LDVKLPRDEFYPIRRLVFAGSAGNWELRSVRHYEPVTGKWFDDAGVRTHTYEWSQAARFALRYPHIDRKYEAIWREVEP
jgi:hypothetical protein